MSASATRPRYLLDTHALLWWLADDPRLGPRMRAIIATPADEIMVSTVSLWEIVVKIRIGKLTADVGAIERAIGRFDIERLDLLPQHLTTLASLPTHHRDPFDHLLIAQAITEDAAFVSQDEVMARYPVRLERCGPA